MSLLKIAAFVVGGIVVFFALDFVVHAIFALLTTLVIVALVAGGGYVAYKVVGGNRRREIRRGQR
jgi:dolichol kinase